MKAKIAIVGSGNIGWALRQLLKDDYDLKQGDIEDGFDALDIEQVKDFLKGTDAFIASRITKLFLEIGRASCRERV